MLRSYADAVSKMKNSSLIGEGEPYSWMFQWYTHSLPGAKATEIARVYPNATDPRRTLAEAMWETCQAHHPGDVEAYFLPWHRMYVYFFERIIRKVSGEPSFTLPYWNYRVSGSLHGVIPPEFRLETDPVFRSLFVPNRNPGVNGGLAIDRNSVGRPLSLSSLRSCDYLGFCNSIDRPLHGNVHVLVGDGQNMGNVPTAANDPIFWFHHCNIDRLWASWNNAGRKNLADSSFLNKTFTFADENGNRVEARVADFLDIGGLAYTYDSLEAVNICTSTPSGKASITRAKAKIERVELTHTDRRSVDACFRGKRAAAENIFQNGEVDEGE
ncbi:MAG: tyrosinase family protein [Acidobacteria bacterium]|nr:tyrosinase family protein [Acidobacteriota bacterium]